MEGRKSFRCERGMGVRDCCFNSRRNMGRAGAGMRILIPQVEGQVRSSRWHHLQLMKDTSEP